ncbi:MAG: hypothetical protein FH752_13860 [Marinobacter adhaerens]|uniref:Uncharacterized protein n=1 Tax=Marinobacter adhaerens TaxID=1033846 RepID=A0A844HXD3_9GAMM|nr:hypothetical protein [Marinobacter adhaerens]
MKWIVLAVIVAIIVVWLYRGKRKNYIEDPDVKTFDEKDYYLTSNDNASDDESSPDQSNPRH